MDVPSTSTSLTGVERLYKYAEYIHSGKILSCRMTRLAIERFYRDIKLSQSNDPSFPYRFDPEKAERIIRFAEATKQYNDQWRGQPLILQPWQCFILGNIFGWIKPDGRRRFRKAFLQVGRKNGKSTLIATLLLFDLLTTNGAQSLIGATKRDQSKIIFRCCKEIIKQNPALESRLKIYESSSRIVNLSKAGFLEALASQEDKLDGLNPSLAVIDEIGSQRDMSLVKVIESGMVSRPEPLIFEIGSATDDLYSAGKQDRDRASRILEGLEADDSFFGISYELDPDDDWTDEKIYIKANPNLGISVLPETLHDLCTQAKSSPSYEGEFKCKNLGIYTTASTAWITPQVWQPCIQNSKIYNFDPSHPYYAVGAVDLSKRNDLTAFTVTIYQKEKYYMIHKAYFPKDQLVQKMKQDNELWNKWTEEGILTATVGSVIDYSIMYRDILELSKEYKINHILFDPYNANSLTETLGEELDLVEVRQNLKTLSPWIKRYEEELLKGNIVDSNPLVAWEFSNAELYRDGNDNVKVIKPKSREHSIRIDHCITSVMAVGRIGSLIDAGEIDLRSMEEVSNTAASFLSELNFYD